MGAAHLGVFLFLLGPCAVIAAISYMNRTRRNRFPLWWCALVPLGPVSVAFGGPWLCGPDVRLVVLVFLWLVAGVVTAYAEPWLGRLLAVGAHPDAPGAEQTATADRPRE